MCMTGELDLGTKNRWLKKDSGGGASALRRLDPGGGHVADQGQPLQREVKGNRIYLARGRSRQRPCCGNAYGVRFIKGLARR